MFRNKSVNVHQFSMIPRADIPRASFRRQSAHKTTFDAGYLIPVYVDEVLPGDTFNFKMTAFARMATPLYPIMDNLYLDSFFFFVPCRLLWDNWKKFMGEQVDPGDSTDYVIPQVETDTGFAVGSLGDYFGLPIEEQVDPTANDMLFNALPFRAYNLIWNEWFRDENLQDSVFTTRADTTAGAGLYTLLRRGKRHDYFTSCLPWPQKGDSVPLPLGTRAPISGIGVDPLAATDVNAQVKDATTTFAGVTYANYVRAGADPDSGNLFMRMTGAGATAIPDVYADLSEATAATINQLRTSFQIQKLLERDARGGTRYTEIVRSHFGVISPDARLQRPEYLGGGSTPVSINPVAQTSGTTVTGSDTPLGSLSAIGTVVTRGHGFTQSFTEHGYIIGLVSVRADLTYQQGVNRLWTRETRYDFYFPAFAHLGEQAVLRKEIYYNGLPANDDLVFGYQERWAEYRYKPSMITSLFRSLAPQSIDGWHLAQEFGSAPTLSDTFIQDNPPMERVLAVGAEAAGQQFIFDSFFDVVTARPMPLYSVPGLIDHF